MTTEAMMPALEAAPEEPARRGPLCLVRLQPDLEALARWATATNQRALRDDMGYALHAALQATLGRLAPKPFAVVRRPIEVQLVGYSTATPEDLRRALGLAASAEPTAASALGIVNPAALDVRPMPDDWRSGETLSFETRIAPVVRSRSMPGGGYPEIDAAFHPDYCGDSPGAREQAHARWLSRELARGGAATLMEQRVLAFSLAQIARRGRSVEQDGAKRRTRYGLLPDLTVRGQLRVEDGAAFDALLRRGLGRHRSFGFGCLLLAPAGAWR
jgi:CRISPR system Cascade subunit CasE